MTDREKKSIYILIAAIFVSAFYYRWHSRRQLEKVNTAQYQAMGEDQVAANAQKLQLLYRNVNKPVTKTPVTKQTAPTQTISVTAKQAASMTPAALIAPPTKAH